MGLLHEMAKAQMEDFPDTQLEQAEMLKSSRNAERDQIGMVGDIIADSRATSPGIRSYLPEVRTVRRRPRRKT
jgi:hypothetical protein